MKLRALGVLSAVAMAGASLLVVALSSTAHAATDVDLRGTFSVVADRQRSVVSTDLEHHLREPPRLERVTTGADRAEAKWTAGNHRFGAHDWAL